jgi:hypothetical protein
LSDGFLDLWSLERAIGGISAGHRRVVASIDLAFVIAYWDGKATIVKDAPKLLDEVEESDLLVVRQVISL